jgi:FMN phosphatase YigB (HAD superfamily)
LSRIGLLLIPLSPRQFRAVRKAAEENARHLLAQRGLCPEVTLDDIYAQLAPVVSDPAAARAIEWRIERSLCFVNPAMRSLVEHARSLGCRTAIVSDTYFVAAQLRELLAYHDMSASLFDAVLVSCERGRGKWSNGALYQDLFQELDAHPGEILHIGASVISDMEKARLVGIEGHHYPRRTPPLEAIVEGERKLACTAEPSVGSLEAVRVLTHRRARGDDDAFRDGALVLGPVLARFADRCAETLARAGVRRVLCVAREGELLGELVRRAAQAAGTPLQIVPSSASPMATARAAMPNVTAESAASLLEGSQRLSAQNILDFLGLSGEASQFLDPESRQRPFPTMEAATRFVAVLFNLPAVRQRIESRQRESWELAFEYFQSLIGDESTIGVVGLGGDGTLQLELARILRRGSRSVRIVGGYLGGTQRTTRLALEGQEAHFYIESDLGRSHILMAACIDPAPAKPEHAAAKKRISDGVLAFQALWLPLAQRLRSLPQSSELLADIDRAAPTILLRWTNFPTKPEADRVGPLHHEEDRIGDVDRAPLCDPSGHARLRRDGVQALFLDTRCRWPQGVVAQTEPRVVSMLRDRWDDPLSMGRLGAWQGPFEPDVGLTSDELGALGDLFDRLRPAQMIFCGPWAPVLARFSQTTGEEASDAFPRLIVAGAAGPPEDSPPGGGPRIAHVPGALDDPATLSAIRSRLNADADVALVLTSDLAASVLVPVLRGLAPFLGKRGMILVAAGRYERKTVETDSPFGPSLSEWFVGTAGDLGFGLYKGGPGTEAMLTHWIVFIHAPDEMTWSGQWMVKAGDTTYADGPRGLAK